MLAYQAADRPPPEPPPLSSHTVIMTNPRDSDTYSVHTVNSDGSEDDSVFGVPELARRCDISSSDSSLDGSDYFTGSDGSSFISAHTSIVSDSSTVHSTFHVDSLGPPPPGSLMDYWDKPIPPSCLHNFPSRLEDLKCNFLEDIDAHSLSSIEFDNSDDDTFFEENPISSRPVQHLTHVYVEPQVVFSPVACLTSPCGELVDSGGNFSMTNRLDALLNVVAIKPFSIGMAAQEAKSSFFCTHRGDFPIKMCDGSVFYTPMFYNAKASETILSPESICFHSNGVLTHWTQSGSTLADGGSISFFDSNGAEVIALSLMKRNGLYYTPVSAIGVNSVDPTLQPSANYSIHYHHSNPDSCDDISIETCDSASSTSHIIHPAHVSTLSFARPHSPPLIPSLHPNVTSLSTSTSMTLYPKRNKSKPICGRLGWAIVVNGN
jgi:hypothetical protein